MKLAPLLALCLVLTGRPLLAVDEFFDAVEEKLTITAFDEQVRARLSGLIDLEGYHLPNPAPGLIDTPQTNLFNPRLTLFLDAQLGPKVYAFVQSRVDRGFDPADDDARMRLDEYAIRVTPWDDGRLSFQVGEFATVVGAWVERHLSWQNPFINAPLPYENLTRVSDLEPEPSAEEFLAVRIDAAKKYDLVPVVWGPSYATGAAISGRLGKVEYAFELKNASLGSRTESWGLNGFDLDRPSYHGRIGFRPNQMWRFGLSGGGGPYFREEAASLLPRGRGLGDHYEKVISQDVSFEWHHWQVWAEVFEARYEVPHVGDADTFLYFVEAKYKLTTELFAALRWNQQLYADVDDGRGGRVPWGNDQWRIDAALGFRPTAHTQLKLQYSLDREDGPGGNGTNHTFAAQFTVRF